MDKNDWLKIKKDVVLLHMLHEAAISEAGKCQDFNSRTGLLLQRLEELESYDLADRVMDLLSVQPQGYISAKTVLAQKPPWRLQERIKNKLDGAG